ncbi:MAG: hypothetical protein WBL46_06395 [Nitrososphaeraceae archaeon]
MQQIIEMGKNNPILENFHYECGKDSDYPEEQTLQYAEVETLCTIADILEDILEQLKK